MRWLDGITDSTDEFEQTPGDCEGQGSLACYRISLEGMMLRLKLQYFGHLMRSVDSLEKTVMLGGIGGRRRRGQQRMTSVHGISQARILEWVAISFSRGSFQHRD